MDGSIRLFDHIIAHYLHLDVGYSMELQELGKGFAYGNPNEVDAQTEFVAMLGCLL